MDLEKVQHSINKYEKTTGVSLKSTPLGKSVLSTKAAERSVGNSKLPPGTVLLVDTSGSMRGEKLDATKEALTGFVDSDGRVFEFNTGVYEVPNLQYLMETYARGSTYMYEALHVAYITGADKIIMITDGQPTDASKDSILRLAEEKKVPIHCVALPGSVDREFLEELCRVSGGGSFQEVHNMKFLSNTLAGMIEYKEEKKDKKDEGVIAL